MSKAKQRVYRRVSGLTTAERLTVVNATRVAARDLSVPMCNHADWHRCTEVSLMSRGVHVSKVGEWDARDDATELSIPKGT